MHKTFCTSTGPFSVYGTWELQLHVFSGHGFSEVKRSRQAGDNLGFETLENHQPVNWFFKTERVINNMSKAGDVVDFDMTADSIDCKEGRRSIRYLIRKCDSSRENMRLYAYYPGFFNEFDAEPGATYRVGFWVKSDSCEFEIRTSAVREHGGGYCESKSLHSYQRLAVWTRYSLEQTICPTMRYLRFELDVRSAGLFQIDGLTIDRLN